MAGMIVKKWVGEQGEEPVARPTETIDEVNDPFARQKLMSWWDQESIARARILVIGAGAIGNELLHNVALLGFRNIAICDMDEIESANLSRTTLFKKEDAGKRKAEVAAERTREMCLADDPRVDWFCGDVIYELGSGVFRHFDLILGCLDNDTTRFYVDRQCTIFGKPWINAGIAELSASLQLFYHKQTGSCFHCGESPDTIARVMSRRASCGKTAIAELKSGKIPTIQVASAVVAGMQAQEAVKHLCGKTVCWGRNHYYQGSNKTLETSMTRPDAGCVHHSFTVADEVTELCEITQGSTMREVMAAARERLGIEGEVAIDLREEQGRELVRSAYCVHCGEEVAIGVPRYRFKDEMAVCEACRAKEHSEVASEPITNTIRCFYGDMPDEILDMTLGQLGIPPAHVLRVYDEEDRLYFVEMTGDLPTVMPNIFGKE